jgi:LmbE family N-acetylglucosaminyl deacetylase
MPATLETLCSGQRPLALPSLCIPPQWRLTVLAPHPDDFDEIAVTMRLFHANANRIELMVLTSGACGVEDGFGGAFDTLAKGVIRENEQRQSCRFFGLAPEQLRFLRLREDTKGHPCDNSDNEEIIASCLAAHAADLVFMPHGNDTNSGHRRCYAMFQRIVAKEKMTLAALLNRDPKTIAMRDDLYLPFGAEAAAWKGHMLLCHQSQHQRNLNTRHAGLDERILGANRAYAKSLACGQEYAEVFEVELYNDGRRSH